MQINLYQYTDYKKYLNDWLTKRTPKIKGGRSRMAEAMGSKHSYLSRVLNGDANVSFEQADQLSQFMGHTPEESHFFILMVGVERAGTPQLKEYYRKQMEKVLHEQFSKTYRKGTKEIVKPLDKLTYFNQWYYGVIHLLLIVDRKPEEIGKQLGLSRATVNHVIQFLQSAGLVVLEKGRYKSTETVMQLEENSPLRARTYMNWRMKAVESMENARDKKDLHGTMVMSVDEKDYGKAKSILREAIEKVRELGLTSGDDFVTCVNFDLFKV